MLLAAASAAPETLLLDPLLPPDGLIAGWDFSQGIAGLDVTDVGPHRLGGRLVNLPTRAVTGARWTGREMCWRHAPRDTRPSTSRRRRVRRGLGHRLRVHGAGRPAERRLPHAAVRGGHADELPFYVRPRRPAARGRALHRVHPHLPGLCENARLHRRGVPERVAAWGAYPHAPDHHPDYGWSTYNRHRDGSGICYSSASARC
jgi:N,N-dimethylformamidase